MLKDIYRDPQSDDYLRFDTFLGRIMPVSTFLELVKEERIDTVYRHNEAPSPEEILEAITLYGQSAFVGFIGYRIGGNRGDRRISIDGLLLPPHSQALLWALQYEPDENHCLIHGDGLMIRLWWD